MVNSLRNYESRSPNSSRVVRLAQPWRRGLLSEAPCRRHFRPEPRWQRRGRRNRSGGGGGVSGLAEVLARRSLFLCAVNLAVVSLNVPIDPLNTESVPAAETLAEVPEHVLRGLPEEVRLLPSAVDKTRIGVWATKPILKGKKFGPFVGDKKKRSQVRNNVYMWEVYYPNLGWMCIDATDPEKGNWLRYVNWACSGEEQNLFPLEINRAIYYKTLKPIAPGEELLVWYNGEDNPEIAAAIEEERASARSKRSSPKSRR
ncbi:hypothetical protein STEG23_007053, partial [Scotinomys teguina]